MTEDQLIEKFYEDIDPETTDYEDSLYKLFGKLTPELRLRIDTKILQHAMKQAGVTDVEEIRRRLDDLK